MLRCSVVSLGELDGGDSKSMANIEVVLLFAVGVTCFESGKNLKKCKIFIAVVVVS